VEYEIMLGLAGSRQHQIWVLSTAGW